MRAVARPDVLVSDPEPYLYQAPDFKPVAQYIELIEAGGYVRKPLVMLTPEEGARMEGEIVALGDKNKAAEFAGQFRRTADI